MSAQLPLLRDWVGMWEGYRMWTETEGSVRLEVPEYRGLSGGVQMAWRHRIDAVRGTYDEDRSLLEYGLQRLKPIGPQKRGARGTRFAALALPFTAKRVGIRTDTSTSCLTGDWSGPFEEMWGHLSRVDCNCGDPTHCPLAGTSDRIGRLVGSVAVSCGRRPLLLEGSTSRLEAQNGVE